MGSPDELFDRAEQLEESGDVSGAISSWRELAKIHPDASVFCRLARLAKKLGEMDEAEGAFRRAIQIDATLGPAYVGLASMAIDAGDYQQAEDLLTTALRHEKNEVAYCMLGVALQGLEKNDEAGESFQRALEIDPAFEEAYFNFGVLKRESEPDRAQALFLKALECEPDYADAHRELGWLLSKKGSLPEGEYHLRRAIELEPNDAWAYIYLANHLWRQGDPVAAVTAYERAAEVAPDRAFPLWSLANFYEDRQEWEMARSLYERALELEPDDVVASMNFGRMLKRKGEPDTAKRYLEHALFLDPNYEAAKTLLAELEHLRSS